MIKVLNDNVLVQLTEAPKTTASGLYVPDVAQDAQILVGKVVEVGDGRITNEGYRVSMNTRINDIVYFPKFNSTKLEIDRKVYYVVSEQYILAVNTTEELPF